MDDFVEERAELALVLVGELTEFGLESFHYHVIVDGEYEHAFVEGEDVLQEFQKFHGSGRANAVEVVDEEDKAFFVRFRKGGVDGLLQFIA